MTTASEDTPIKPWHAVRRPSCTATASSPRARSPRARASLNTAASASAPRKRTAAIRPIRTTRSTFFALSSGRVIDGGDEGNDARWINHSCEPNCEAQEGKHGKRVYIVAVRDIARGEEPSYDYGLVLDGRITRRCATATAASAARRRVAAPCWLCRTSRRRRRRRSWPRPGRPRRSPWPRARTRPRKTGRFEASGEAGRQTGRTVGRKAGRQTRSQAGRARASERPGRHQAGAETRPQAGRSHCPAGSSPVQGPAAKRRATHKTAPVPSPPETPPAAGVLPRPAPAGVQSAGR